MNATETQSPTLQRDYRSIIWRWKWIAVACIVLLPLGSYLVASRTRPQYSSSALIQVVGPAIDTSLFNTVVVPTPQDTVLNSVARLVTIASTAHRAASYLHAPPRDPLALLQQVTATADTSSGFITVTATDPSATRAAAVANAFAQAVVTDRIQSAVTELNAAISQLGGQIAATPRSDPARLQLSDQLQRFRALRAAQGSNAQVVEAAVAPRNPTTPGVTQAVVLGLIIAVLIAIGLVVFAESRDRRIRAPEEVEGLTGLPLLGAIPATAFSGAELTGSDEEAFRTLRNSLTYFNIDRRISSVLITSPVKEDGKTTVAANLAIAMARGGRDVILVEADLRRPAAALRFGIAESLGLGAVLVAETSLGNALTDVALAPGGDGRLRILAAGSLPPNPSELIGSHRMRGLIRELESLADLVILDSTPLLTVSDSLPLLEAVSGVVLIGRLNTTSRESLVRLWQVVAAAGGKALGVVVTGVSHSGLYPGYGYNYGYTARTNGSVKPVAAENPLGPVRREDERGVVAPP